jgi:hypothetical protein
LTFISGGRPESKGVLIMDHLSKVEQSMRMEVFKVKERRRKRKERKKT